ncbi:MAG: hypothetical protein ACK47B_18015 [Armatimonadota bacterium]
MKTRWKQIAAVVWLTVSIIGALLPATAQEAPAPVLQPGIVVRRIVMKDAASAEAFKTKLEQFKSTGLFRDALPSFDPKKPINTEISFLSSGNFLLVMGSQEWVDRNIEAVRLMGFLFDRPRAHLQLNLRVVQLTGPANAEVIQMSETVKALVDSQRDEVVRAFADLGDYLQTRLKQRQGSERAVFESTKELFPTLADGTRPMTVPEILMLLMLDRTSPSPAALTPNMQAPEADPDSVLLELSRVLAHVAKNPRSDDAKAFVEMRGELDAWKKVITAARDWCAHFAQELDKKQGGASVNAFREALEHPGIPLPGWIARRMKRSLELTDRLYPNLVRKHTHQSLEELQRRFQEALDRVAKIETALTTPAAVEQPKKDAKDGEAAPIPIDRTGHNLLALKTLADEMVPAPLALFETVALAADNSAPTPEQVIAMFSQYSAERRRLDGILYGELPPGSQVNYPKLQALESALNLWMRRVSEGMARALESHFYRRYVNELRLLANKQLGKSSNRDLLQEASIDEVPDVTRDLLLNDTGVNIFVTNSVSLQFAQETMNSVSAQVQAQLPSKQSIQERVQQASQASGAINALSQQFGINGESLVKSLLAGGQAVPVQSGINLTATPSIGFDAGTVALTLTASQTLQPNSDKVADRVTNHSINNATVTALSYEPMVLSSLTSNVSYYENSGGIPIIRKIPILKDVAKDIPLKPFKEGKREKGIYQSSVIILEPVVIPTIEDLVRFHTGWRDELIGAMMGGPTKVDPAAAAAAKEAEEAAALAAAVAAKVNGGAAPAPMMPAPAAPAAPAPMPAAMPAPAAPPKQ